MSRLFCRLCCWPSARCLPLRVHRRLSPPQRSRWTSSRSFAPACRAGMPWVGHQRVCDRGSSRVECADALHITGPSSDQPAPRLTGGTTGSACWRRESQRYRSASPIASKLRQPTSRPPGSCIWRPARGRGPRIAVQLVAVYSDREGGQGWVVPAAAFFQLADGKIRRARIYYAEGERAPVEPEPRRRPPK
jgi:hypothetical protein